MYSEVIIKQKEHLDPALKKELKAYVFDIVGVIQDVFKELPNGLPEYVYQEALAVAFEQDGVKAVREYRHHPEFRGRQLQSFLKMDFMIPRSRGNVIIECKAIEELTSKEYQQLFSYMIGTQYPIGIIVNFHSFPNAVVHKFYFDKKDNTITSF